MEAAFDFVTKFVEDFFNPLLPEVFIFHCSVRLASEAAPARIDGHAVAVHQPVAVRAAVEHAIARLAIAGPGDAVLGQVNLDGVDLHRHPHVIKAIPAIPSARARMNTLPTGGLR